MQSASDGKPRKETAILVIAIITAAAILGIFGSILLLNRNSTIQHAVSEQLSSFQSYSELQNFIAANAQSAQQYSNHGIGFGLPTPLFAPTASPAMAASSVQSAPSYTGTNVQVSGVDEPDRVKTDGFHVFVSNGNSVSILSTYPKLSVLSTLSFGAGTVLGLEISQNNLLVINQRFSNMSYVDLVLYDVSNPTSPSLVQNTSIAGNYVAARMSEGYLYAVIQQPSYQFSGSNPLTLIPTIANNGVASALPPSSVYYTPNRAQISYYTMITSVSMTGGSERTVSVLTGPSSTIYVSLTNIYVVYENYQEFYADGIPGDVFGAPAMIATSIQPENSTIFRASYLNGSVDVRAVGSVPGTVLNQFSMDEYNGYFRVATSRFAASPGGTATRSDDIYVLDGNMNQVSALTNIAPGENLYAVRFVGVMGYVVTFEQIDPLFAISFQDIQHPVILSALKVSGYSDYLQPLWNGYLIGVGKDAVPDSSGNLAWYLGLKLSLFHIYPNGSSAEVSNYLIGDRGTDSPVLNDHLAFTYDPQNNITVIPVLLAKVSGNQTYAPDSPPQFGDYVWQGAYVFKVTQTGFTLLGNVSQYPSGQNYGDSANNNLRIDRSAIIGNYLYTFSASEVMVSDLSAFATLATVNLS